MRFSIREEEVLEEGCRCFSCFRKTGRFLVMDSLDRYEDEVFPTLEEARKRVIKLEAEESSLEIIFDLINLGLIPPEISIEDPKIFLAQGFLAKRLIEFKELKLELKV